MSFLWGFQLIPLWSAHLLGSLCRCLLAGIKSIAGVLEDLTGATRLVLLPPEAADKEELGGAFSQGRFGLFGQDVAVPLLALQHRNKPRLPQV